MTHRLMRDGRLQSNPWASMLLDASFAEQARGHNCYLDVQLPNSPSSVFEDKYGGGKNPAGVGSQVLQIDGILEHRAWQLHASEKVPSGRPENYQVEVSPRIPNVCLSGYGLPCPQPQD